MAGRVPFVHDGRTVYEWEQSLDEVLVYISPPPGARAAHIECAITSAHVRVGIKGNPPYLDVRAQGGRGGGSAIAGSPLSPRAHAAPAFSLPPCRPPLPRARLQEDLGGTCVAKESMWTLDEGVLLLTLTKARKAETWAAAFRGHAAAGGLDAAAQAAVHKKMLLERFQEENPGFDFSGADVNGAVPDPRTFMGGPGAPR
jgi:hypothetical protein